MRLNNSERLAKIEATLDNIYGDTRDIKDHLTILNGSVAANTAHRNKQSVINQILTWVATAIGGSLLALFVKIFGGF